MGEPIRRPRDRLTGHPQERQHSAAERGTRERLPPARGAKSSARGIVTEWPRRQSRYGISSGSVSGGE